MYKKADRCRQNNNISFAKLNRWIGSTEIFYNYELKKITESLRYGNKTGACRSRSKN